MFLFWCINNMGFHLPAHRLFYVFSEFEYDDEDGDDYLDELPKAGI